MAKCNLKMTDNCYGCPYYGNGDVDGCQLTIVFHKKYPNHTDEEYKQYMISNRIKKGNNIEVVQKMKKSVENT